ncbi:hypothetical protein [Alicyclobacillus suci]|uniref:hypothetical protein n=1 Tax=Alicyclobacillus suci TaxID=2816080 RepID=UPI001A8C9A6A|nr:hypothetical protein [Alicyclobacillus suci]
MAYVQIRIQNDAPGLFSTGSCNSQIVHAALQDPYAVGCMIDRLCTACRDKLTPAQRAAAIRFVISQRCNPANPRHRARMRRMVFGY